MISTRRRTGKTSRMLLEASRQALTGKKVIVAMVNHSQAYQAFRQVWDAGYPGMEANIAQLVIKFPHTGGYVAFSSSETEGIDWHRGTVYGEDSNSELLVDHFAIEERFGWLLDMWLKFNTPNSTMSTVGAD